MEGHPEEYEEGKGIVAVDDLKTVKGIGLGLYTAYHLVKLLGGKLKQSADATTNEACFWFTLPLQTVVSEIGSVQAPGSIITRNHSKSQPQVTFATLSACDQGVGIDLGLALVSRQTTIEMNAESNNNSGCNSQRKEMRVLIVDDSAICQKVGVYTLIRSHSEAMNAVDVSFDNHFPSNKHVQVLVRAFKNVKGYSLTVVTDVASNGKEACDMLSSKSSLRHVHSPILFVTRSLYPFFYPRHPMSL